MIAGVVRLMDAGVVPVAQVVSLIKGADLSELTKHWDKIEKILRGETK